MSFILPSLIEKNNQVPYRKRIEAEKRVCAIPIVLDIFLQFILIQVKAKKTFANGDPDIPNFFLVLTCDQYELQK